MVVLTGDVKKNETQSPYMNKCDVHGSRSLLVRIHPCVKVYNPHSSTEKETESQKLTTLQCSYYRVNLKQQLFAVENSALVRVGATVGHFYLVQPCFEIKCSSFDFAIKNKRSKCILEPRTDVRAQGDH